MDVDSEVAPDAAAPDATVAAPQGEATNYSLMFRCTKYVVLDVVNALTIADLARFAGASVPLTTAVSSCPPMTTRSRSPSTLPTDSATSATAGTSLSM